MADSKHSGKLIIQSDTRIGHVAAENDDTYLFECFVDNKALSIAMDTNTPGMIIAGRTGSGKTAILRYIEKHCTNTRIEPAELALQYISNSDVLRFLSDIGADLDIMFQTIWKHVLCIEYIRMRYNIENLFKSKNWFLNLFNKFHKDPLEKRALDYLRQWEDSFWVDIDENVKIIVKNFEEKLNAEIGVDISKFESKAGYGRNLSESQKSEYSARVRKVIHSEQLRDLSKVLDLLKKNEISDKNFSGQYLLIDNLDDRWIDESLKYKMINALVESLKSFGKIRNLKILVALRTDVIERVLQENSSSGFQREKFNDYIIKISWKESELKQIVDRRIGYLYRSKYTKQNVLFDDIFSTSVRGSKPFQYLVERTLLRPRDIISFVNYCLECSEDKVDVNHKNIIAAERVYSAERRTALEDEWRNAFPTLGILLNLFSNGTPSRIYEELATKDKMQEIALQICGESQIAADPLYRSSNKIFPTKGEPSGEVVMQFASSIFEILYRVGAIGIKNSDSPYEYYFKNGRLLKSDQISADCKLIVVKMLNCALSISEKRRPR